MNTEASYPATIWGAMSMFVPFSKRNRPPHDTLTYEIPVRTKQMIIYTISDYSQHYRCGCDAFFNLEEVFDGLGRTLLREYGELEISSDGARRALARTVVEHFYQCKTELALDFLEFLSSSTVSATTSADS